MYRDERGYRGRHRRRDIRRNTGKILFGLVFIVVGVVSVTLAAVAMGNNSDPVEKLVVIEAGQPIPDADAFLTTEAKEKGLEVSFLTQPQGVGVGQYEIEIQYGDKTYPTLLEIRDTQPPAGIFMNKVSVSGEQIAPEDFIQSFEDATIVTALYETEPDFITPGNHSIWVKLKDEGGNETIINGYLTVYEGRNAIQMELGYPPETITLQDFLYNTNDLANAQFITDVAALNLSSPGTVPIEVIVNGAVARVGIEIIDTIPPAALVRQASSYIGQIKYPWDFVQDAVDAGEIEYTFKTVPDWETPGTQPVTVLLTDMAGNVSEFESALTVTEDFDPPVISGIDSKYAMIGGAVAYRKDVTAWDANDGDIEFTVDSSMVDLFNGGEYPVYYRAQDKKGNLAEAVSYVVVTTVDPEEVYAMADAILAQIITEDMTAFDKGKAIYNYVKNNVHYDSSGEKQDIVKGAYNGLQMGRGDCYTFFALSKLMLDRVGIPNYDLERVGGQTRHYWSLVHTGGGWLHFDACPYREVFNGYQFTESQARAYSDQRGRNYYVYDYEALPPEIEVVWE